MPNTALALTAPAVTVGSKNFNALRQSRFGVMLHFDDSSSDDSAVQWFRDPACQVSYNRLYLDDGRVVQIVPTDARAWHAGVCRVTSDVHDANSAFYGLSAATDTRHPVTPQQMEAICRDAAALFVRHGWPAADVERRIVGHEDWAVFPAGHPKAGQLGRKIDPTGYDRAHPILSTEQVRVRVAILLAACAAGSSP